MFLILRLLRVSIGISFKFINLNLILFIFNIITIFVVHLCWILLNIKSEVLRLAAISIPHEFQI